MTGGPDTQVLDLLRAATGPAHQALDGGLDIVARLAGPQLLGTLQGYYALHAAAEAAMLPHLSGIAGLDPARRCRAALVADGLRRLGAVPLPCGPAAPPVASPAAALGMLYVMEGSSLGGRMILRRLQQQGADTVSLGFLDPYGAQVGVMWRDLQAVLERELAPLACRQAASATASATFAFAAACLMPQALVDAG